MDELYTFRSACGFYEITIKRNFLKLEEVKRLDIEKTPIVKLFIHGMMMYLHNPNGPAIKWVNGKREEYWIDGKMLQGEDEKRMKSNLQFKDTFNKALNG